jgi:ADP-ribose pyrophosphatase
MPVPLDRWTLLKRRCVSDHRIFRIHEDRYRFESNGAERDFVVLDSPDWINVVPVTGDGQVVLIRQYRHGTREATLEVPGGIVEPGEDPYETARRELVEETGFVPTRVRLLGTVAPNPAIQNNHCHCFVAEGATKSREPALDPWEYIEVVLEPLERIPELVHTGAIQHALVVASFGLMGLLAGGTPR